MSTRKFSHTALATAYIRAAHQLLDAAPLILEDSVGEMLLGPAARQRILDEPERYQTPEAKALRAHIVLRSRFAEDRLAEAVQRGIKQYVVLGAGFDSFAYRQPVWAQQLQIIEVDHLGTQSLKLNCLNAASLAIPENVKLINIDFETESLQSGLGRNQVALEHPTFFSWLGVTMYLEEAAIDRVLRSAALFPAESEIVLTFAPSPAGGGGSHAASPIARRAADSGEPWLSYFTPEEIAAKLRDAGFSKVFFLTPAEAQKRYFSERPHDLPMLKRTNLVSAIK